MFFRQIADRKLAQYTYLVGCEATGEALIIDPERDVDRYLELAESEDLEVTAVAETHIHADFLSGAREVVERLDVQLYVSGEGGEDWSYRWVDGNRRDGRPYRVTRLTHGDSFRVGKIEIRAVHTPGHTPEHLSFLVIDHGSGADEPMGMVTGDFVFVGDLGRPDLLETAAGQAGVQEGAARLLYGSLPRFLEQEDHVQVWPGHGAGSACGKAMGAVPISTVGYERSHNVSLREAEKGEDAFVDSILEDQSEPPLYFGRMKVLNRDGMPLLGELPRPRELTAGELEDPDALVVDARTDRSAFMRGHLPGSVWASLDGMFSTRVGSVVTDPERPIVLVVEPSRGEEAVRDLVRIGLDRVVGFVRPETLRRHLDRTGGGDSIPEIGFDGVDELRKKDGMVVLDVRYASEYEKGHVPGAVNASYTRLPETYEDRVPAEGTLVVHCSSGVRSAVAASWLHAQGRDVRYVGDAWARWEDGEHPVETGESPYEEETKDLGSETTGAEVLA